jgi:hypothetical protein
MSAPRVNKRRYVRTRAQNLVAHLRVGDRTIQAPVDDISMGGMLARTAESIPIGTAVMFDLARPGLKKPLRLLGVVVDTRVGRGLGIRFDGLDREGGDRLAELIKDLGGMTSSLLVDKPEESSSSSSSLGVYGGSSPSIAVPAELRAQAQHQPQAAVNVAPLRTGLTGTFTAPQPGQPGPTELELKLQAQARSMVMEIGRLQELVQQREKELHDARSEIERLRAENSAGDAAQRIVGRLEIEKNKLEGQLADAKTRMRVDVDIAMREAEQSVGALGRLLEALRRVK